MRRTEPAAGTGGRSGGGRARLCVAWLVALMVMACSASVAAASPAMIPPGQEDAIRRLVGGAITATREAGELPVALAERVDIHIDRDHFRVVLHREGGEGSGAGEAVGAELPELLVHHPAAFSGEGEARGGRIVGPGLALRCHDAGEPRPCGPDEIAPWRALVGAIEAQRAAVASNIWRVEERVQGPAFDAQVEGSEVRARWAVDRGLVVLGLVLGLGLLGFAAARARGREDRPRWPELLALLALVGAYVGASLRYTAMLPLHEHNSFVARSDCAITPSCPYDPASAWNLGSLNSYGFVLEQLPHYDAGALSHLSLGLSAVVLVLSWALARVLVRRLGRPELAGVAGLTTVAVWATSPVAWRLGSSASFWPWALVWILCAALAGLWAGELGREQRRSSQLVAWLAWQLAAVALILASGGNFVLLTLGACHGLAPLAWTGAWDQPKPARRRAWLKLGLAAAPTLVAVGWASAANLGAGLERIREDSVGDHFELGASVITDALIFDGRLGMLVWALGLVCALAWLAPSRRAQQAAEGQGGHSGDARWRGPRLLAPLLYAWLVPGAFLGVAAGEVVGGGYPVGFINHHWELCFSALAVGLGLAWLLASLERRWPELGGLAARAPSWAKGALAWTVLIPLLCTLIAARQGSRADEAWRLATGSRVVERELVALEAAFAELPAHELLILPPQLAAPMSDAPSEWDPLEVHFPVHAYAEAMRARGLEPARIVRLDRLDLAELPAELDALLYVGSSMRSFQPHEIATQVVPDSLERVELERLQQTHALEVVVEFRVSAEQHEAISMRLGADRLAELELGFYRLHRSSGG